MNTMGKQMFHAGSSAEYIGSLMSPGGRVGGGQARMTALPCDPTMLFMADNIRIISNLYNKPVRCMMDANNIYVQQLEWEREVKEKKDAGKR